MARPEAPVLAAAALLLGCCPLALGTEQHGPAGRSGYGPRPWMPARLAIRQKDFTGARRLLEQLARSGNMDAQYLLGSLLLTNPQGEADIPGARTWLQQAAAAGEPRAAYMLSVLAATATPPDVAAATRWLEAAARGGVDAAAQLQRQGRLPMSFLPALDLTEAAARTAAFDRAVAANDVATLQRLGMGAAAINAPDAFGRTALAHAASRDAGDALAWLLGAGADVKARDKSGATALMLAAGSERGVALDPLLRAGSDVKASDATGNTALHFASATPDAVRVTKLLAAGALANAANRDGDQPMDIAQRADHATVVAALSAAGAVASRPASIRAVAVDAVQRPKGIADLYAGRSDLEIAASRRDTRVLKGLLAPGTASEAQKSAALLAAADAGSLDAVKLLLSSGASVTARDARARTLAGIAVQEGNLEILQAGT